MEYIAFLEFGDGNKFELKQFNHYDIRAMTTQTIVQRLQVLLLLLLVVLFLNASVSGQLIDEVGTINGNRMFAKLSGLIW